MRGHGLGSEVLLPSRVCIYVLVAFLSSYLNFFAWPLGYRDRALLIAPRDPVLRLLLVGRDLS